MAIRPHYPKNVKPYYPTVLDIETDPDGQVIGVGLAFSDDDNKQWYLDFQDFNEWWEWYEPEIREASGDHRRRLLRIYAHNGGNFDWISLVKWAHKQGMISKCHYILSNSAGIGCNIQLSKRFGMLRLRDSMRLMPGSLKSVTSCFNIRHKKLDLDDRLPHIVKANDPDLFWEYLRNDVLGLQETLYEFWSMIYQHEGSIGELPMTLPSLAMRLWQKTLPGPILTPRNKKLKALERLAYRGGRTECHQTGVHNIVSYDINSQYPSVMLSGVYPLSYVGCWVDTYRHRHGVYEIEFCQTNRNVLPVLYDCRKNEYVYEGYGAFFQPEIEKMLQVGGRIVKFYRGYEYKCMGNPFKEFINLWWQRRLTAQQEGNEGLRYVAKILMNSLYGKLAQREETWTMQALTGKEMQEKVRNGERIKIYGDFCMVHEETDNEHVFVGIAGYVTAQARLLLYSYMRRVPLDAIVYNDTDSLHVKGQFFDSSTDLGNVKKEKEGEVAYAGKKLYYPKDGKLVAKGIGSKARGQIPYKTFAEMATGNLNEILTEFSVFPTPKEAFLHNKPAAVQFNRTRRLKRTGGQPQAP